MQTVACAGVLLAAGASRRLGYPKQLLQVEAETLLHRTTRLALEAGLQPVQVVLGSRAEELQSAIADLPIQIVINQDWPSGMASSLRTGLSTLQATTTHALILVCDQVALTADQLRQLLATSAAHPEKIIASAYGGQPGVPAVFPSAFFDHLLAIEGDRGARELLRTHCRHVLSLAFDHGTLDIDTAEDVIRANLLHENGVHFAQKAKKVIRND